MNHENETGNSDVREQRISFSLPHEMYQRHQAAIDASVNLEKIAERVEAIKAAFERLQQDSEMFDAIELLACGAVESALRCQKVGAFNASGSIEEMLDKAKEISRATFVQLVTVSLVMKALREAGEDIWVVGTLGRTLKAQIWPLDMVTQACVSTKIVDPDAPPVQ